MFIGTKYQTIRSLGTGAVSEVFLARDLSEDKSPLVAIKLLKIAKDKNDYIEEFFNREVQALKQLHHPGIVNYYNSGYDEDQKAYYIVIEYIEGDCLEQFVSGDRVDLIKSLEITIKILDALHYSHGKSVYHRDIKPSNIIIDIEENPRIVDFGVSKVYSVVSSGLTVRNYISIPYAAPEQLLNQPADTKTDIFLVGAVLFKLLSGKDPLTDTELIDQFSVLTIEEDLLLIIRKMVARNLDERFASANQAKIALQLFLNEYNKENVVHFLAITNAAINKLYTTGFIKCNDETEARSFLEQELNSVATYAMYDSKYQAYSIIGRQIKLSCQLDKKSNNYLVVTKIFIPDGINLERDKESGIEIVATWRIIRGLVSPDGYCVRYLLDELSSISREKDTKKQNEISQKDMVSSWEKVLELQSRILDAENAIQYTAFDLSSDGDSIELIINNQDVYFDEDQPILISQRGFEKYILVGYYQDTLRRDNKNILIITLSRDAEVNDIAESGEVVIDNRQLKSALIRQQRAIRALKYNESINTFLPSILLDPSLANRSKEVLEIKNFYSTLDKSKQEAIRNAIRAKDIFLIQGPPGTGKTTVISELVAQITSNDVKAKILISSQSNVAVNHALVKIAELIPELPMIRIGRKEKIAQGAETFLFEERLKSFATKTRNRSNKYSDHFRKSLNISDDILDSLTLLEETNNKEKLISGLKDQHDNIQEQINELTTVRDLINTKNEELVILGRKLREILDSLEDESGFKEFLISDVSSFLRLGDEVLDVLVTKSDVINKYNKLTEEKCKIEDTITEFESDCKVTCQLVAETLSIILPEKEIREILEILNKETAKYKQITENFTQIESIRKEWLKRIENVFELEEVCVMEAAVIAATCIGVASSSIISNLEYDYVIVDEAGRATPPEILVPIVRGKKIIMVGDQKQLPPIVDNALTNKVLEQIDLNRSQLETTLFEQVFSRACDEVKITLKEQYRMHPTIGDLISTAFYDNEIISKTKAEDKNHKLKWWPVTVIWYSTSSLDNRFEQANLGTSKQNLCEAKYIEKILEEIETSYRQATEKRKVAVISSYNAQKQLLRTKIDAEDKNRWQQLTIEIDTVHAFQGRESDIVIYSLVRSNVAGNLGFVSDYRMLNVALSRAKQLLIIVGDHDMARGSYHSPNPFTPIIKFINDNAGCKLEVLK